MGKRRAKNNYFESEIPLHVRYGYYQLLWFHLYSYDSMGINGQRHSKTEKGEIGLLGNVIDTYMQGMQYGQTNGIPQGSVLFDFIAEMVLGYADSQVSEVLASNDITDYKILRYRDDYRIFCNRKDELEKIAFVLQDILANLNFQLNRKCD